jgi:hypothetical protein
MINELLFGKDFEGSECGLLKYIPAFTWSYRGKRQNNYIRIIAPHGSEP